jgi:hypothetical protein
MSIRSGLALMLAILAFPAVAADGWDSYANSRYGYETAIPPGFVGRGEPDAHDGQVFRSSDGQQVLTVWGGYLSDSSVSEDARSRLADYQRQGWNITYQASTPTWASYSGTKGQRVIYVREIAGCKGEQYATFELQYPSTLINATKPLVERLVKGLKQRFCDGN